MEQKYKIMIKFITEDKLDLNKITLGEFIDIMENNLSSIEDIKIKEIK